MYKRLLDLSHTVTRRSAFLFGPRATGKSTLLREQFPQAAYYDLLSANTFGKLLRRPQSLEEETTADELIIIDEVQKLPGILDEAHRLIANRNQKFILTGSSARKLKHGGANLLAGRARWRNLYPLTYKEIPDFDLKTYMNTGGLPQIYGDEEANLDLRAYVNLYMKEEIQAEALTRNLGAFAHTLDIVAKCNGQEINATNIGNDVGVSGRTILNYLEILEDTLVAFQLPVFSLSKKRRPRKKKKLYLFDLGVTKTLTNTGQIVKDSPQFGQYFEHFLILEVRAALSYLLYQDTLTFWRTTSGFEVDMVIGDHTAIAIKASQNISDKHLKGLRAIAEEHTFKKLLLVCRETTPKKTPDGISILPWETFLEGIWAGEFFEDK